MLASMHRAPHRNLDGEAWHARANSKMVFTSTHINLPCLRRLALRTRAVCACERTLNRRATEHFRRLKVPCSFMEVRSSYVARIAAVRSNEMKVEDGGKRTMKLMVTFLRPKAPASHVASPIALAATPHEGHSRSSLVGSLVSSLSVLHRRMCVCKWWCYRADLSRRATRLA